MHLDVDSASLAVFVVAGMIDLTFVCLLFYYRCVSATAFSSL